MAHAVETEKSEQIVFAKSKPGIFNRKNTVGAKRIIPRFFILYSLINLGEFHFITNIIIYFLC